MDDNQPKRILIIDDEAGIRQNLKTYFKLKGYEVDEIGNSLQALKELKKAGTYKVVICDNQMPGVSGEQLIPMIHAHGAKIIFMSGHFTKEDIIGAREKGVAHCLVKPIPMNILDALVYELFYDQEKAS